MLKTVAHVDLPVLETMSIKKNTITSTDVSSNSKRCCVVTGIHGDELDGQYICYELIRRLEANLSHFHGIIDIYPALNPLGIESITRSMPTFDLDMNSSFPGRLNGDLLEYSSAKIVEDIEGADFCIDLHSSDIFLREIPQVRIQKEHVSTLLPYAKRINCDFVWVHSSLTVLESTLAYSLNGKGIPTLAVEMGVGMRITKEYADQLVEGIFSLLKELGMWSGPIIEPRKPIISSDGEVTFIHAEASGILLPATQHWKDIQKGELIGTIVNPYTGKINQEILAPHDGVVFTLREYPVVYQGSLIARILGGVN